MSDIVISGLIGRSVARPTDIEAGPDERHFADDDPNAPARGLILAMLMGMLFWVLVGAAVVKFVA